MESLEAIYAGTAQTHDGAPSFLGLQRGEYIGIITNTDFGQAPKWTEKPGEASCSSGAYWTRLSSWTLPL